MTEGFLILSIIKLFLGAIAAFFAILLWSRTHDSAWVCLVAGAIFSYVRLVFEFLMRLGIVNAFGPFFGGVQLSDLIFTVLPYLFFISAFILMLSKSRR